MSTREMLTKLITRYHLGIERDRYLLLYIGNSIKKEKNENFLLVRKLDLNRVNN